MLATCVVTFAQFRDKPVRLPITVFCATHYTANLGGDTYQAVCFANPETMRICKGGSQYQIDFFLFVEHINTDKSGT